MVTAGWVVLILLGLFLMGASVAPKLLGSSAAIDPLTRMGFDSNLVLPIGIMEAVFTVGFLVPKTAAISGILMTGLLGGAIASQLRIKAPIYSHTLFGIYIGIAMWAGICLRDPNIASFLSGSL